MLKKSRVMHTCASEALVYVPLLRSYVHILELAAEFLRISAVILRQVRHVLYEAYTKLYASYYSVSRASVVNTNYGTAHI